MSTCGLATAVLCRSRLFHQHVPTLVCHAAEVIAGGVVEIWLHESLLVAIYLEPETKAPPAVMTGRVSATSIYSWLYRLTVSFC